MKYDEECEAAEKRHSEGVGRWDAIGLGIQELREAVEGAQADQKRAAILDWLCKVDPSVIRDLQYCSRAAQGRHKRMAAV